MTSTAFRKRGSRKALRRPAAAAAARDSDDEGESAGPAVAQTVSVAPQVQRAERRVAAIGGRTKSSRKSMMSFEDDSDSGEKEKAVVQKRRGGKAVADLVPRKRPPPPPATSDDAAPADTKISTNAGAGSSSGPSSALQATDYSKGALEALRKNTYRVHAAPRSLGSDLPPGSESDPLVLEGDEALALFGGASEDVHLAHVRNMHTRHDNIPSIPDAAAIRAARERRSRLRDGLAAGDEFVPLDSRAKAAFDAAVAHSASAAADDDYDDGSSDLFEDDDQQVIRFGMPASRTADERAARQRAVHAATRDPILAKEQALHAISHVPQPYGKGTFTGAGGDSENSALTDLFEAMSVEDLTGRLSVALRTLRDTHTETKVRLERARAGIEEAPVQTEEREQALRAASERFDFFQQMRAFVTDLLDCLEVKAADIEAIEQRAFTARSVPFRRIADRQQERDQDEHELYELVVEGRTRDYHGQTDEFGRDLSLARGAQLHERRRRRATRRAERRATRRISDRDPEGWSSDSDTENTEPAAAEVDAIETASKDASALWDDTGDDFRTVAAVCERFAEWRHAHPKEYADAAVARSLATIVSWYARIELVQHDVFASVPEMENMEWCKAAVSYSASVESPDTELVADDVMLVPRVIESAFLPLCKRVIADAWCPYSRKHTQTVVALVRGASELVDPDSTPYIALRNAVAARLREAATSLFVPSLPERRKCVGVGAGAAGDSLWEWLGVFATRQAARAVKLVHIVQSMKSVLAEKDVEDIAFRILLREKVAPALQALAAVADETRDRARVVAAAAVAAADDGWLGHAFMYQLLELAA